MRVYEVSLERTAVDQIMVHEKRTKSTPVYSQMQKENIFFKTSPPVFIYFASPFFSEDTSEDDMEDEEAVTPTDDSPEPPTKGEEDVQENKDETEQYFEGLASASTPVKEKAEPIELKSDEESKPSGKYGFSRQSISRRFLSRSQQSTTK